MFRDIKLYKKKFMLYLFVLLSLCGVFSSGITYMILQSRSAAISNDAQRAFERTERDLSRRKNEMEFFIQRIYGNPALLKDLLLYMSGNAETYLSKRLDFAAKNEILPSIVEAIDEFNTITSDRMYRQICILSESRSILMDYNENGTRISFLPGENGAVPESAGENGITFKRALVDTNGKNMGTASFLLDAERAFSTLQYTGLPNMAICDSYENVYKVQNGDRYSDRAFQEISESGESRGTYKDGKQRLFYSIYTSSEYGYHFICAYDAGYLLASTANLLLTAYLGMLFVFGLILLLIFINMRHEAEFLTVMLENIGKMETGHFEQMGNRYGSKNEYGMIAGALNSMGKKLEKHIQTEYLLKLKQQETEMIALQHQINPHFLYNTLEIIRSGAIRGMDVGGAIASLGKMYRNMVSDKLEITLEEEVNLLNAYLEIMEFRNKGNFYYQTEIEEPVKSLMTVKFWMQPIAENFFVHGYDKDSAFNLFVLSAYEDERAYHIELMNNGAKMEEAQLQALQMVLQGESGEKADESIGFKNVYARLRYYYGTRLKMAVMNNEESGITVRVSILKEEAAGV